MKFVLDFIQTHLYWLFQLFSFQSINEPNQLSLTNGRVPIKNNYEKSSNELITETTNRLLESKFRGNTNFFLDELRKLEVQAPVRYHSYIGVDALLGLQLPRTDFADEITFIILHQQFELSAKLCNQELDLIQNSFVKNGMVIKKEWSKRLPRIIKHFELLTTSFELLSTRYFDTEEFFLFRMALTPASGFQTAQFREIELKLTQLKNLTFSSIDIDKLNIKLTEEEKQTPYLKMYWKLGGRNSLTGEKSQMLKDFENKYDNKFTLLASRQEDINLNFILERTAFPNELKPLLWKLGKTIVEWKKRHKDVVLPHTRKFGELSRKYNWKIDPNKGTGGTNYSNYLNASLNINYFPSLKNEIYER